MSATTVPVLATALLESLLTPAADAAGRTGLYKTLKGAHVASIIVQVNQGNAATVLLTPLQATNVAGAGSKVLTNNCAIYLKADDTSPWTRVADAKNYTTSAALATKLVRFDIDPAALDVAGGFDTVSVSTGASNAANITAASLVIGPTRYSEDAPVSAAAN